MTVPFTLPNSDPFAPMLSHACPSGERLDGYSEFTFDLHCASLTVVARFNRITETVTVSEYNFGE